IKSVQGATLYPGMTATVTVTTAEHKDVVLVPNSALTFAKSFGGAQQAQGQSGDFVVVLENGRIRRVKVTTGMTDGTNTEITSGLEAGQAVVTSATGATGTGANRTGNNAQRNAGPFGGPGIVGPGGGPGG